MINVMVIEDRILTLNALKTQVGGIRAESRGILLRLSGSNEKFGWIKSRCDNIRYCYARNGWA